MTDTWGSKQTTADSLQAGLDEDQAAQIRSWQVALEAEVPFAKDHVMRAVKTWNQAIRDQLRDEMGFRLSTKDRQVSVPVTVAEGIPIAVLKILGPANSAMEELQLRRALFAATTEGLAVTQGLLPQVIKVLRDEAPTARDRESLKDTLRLLIDLNEALNRRELPKRILAIDRDVLGAYIFHRPEVRVFWLPIAILSVSAEMPIEALTFVVLAHELAHAYTHLGHDIDGMDWETREFADGDPELVEGLAQYYTESICKNLQDRYPAALDCFETILEKQPLIYKAYKGWDESASGESMRMFLRMVSQRNRPVPAYFEDNLFQP